MAAGLLTACFTPTSAIAGNSFLRDVAGESAEIMTNGWTPAPIMAFLAVKSVGSIGDSR